MRLDIASHFESYRIGRRAKRCSKYLLIVLSQKLGYVSTVPGTRKVLWFSSPLCNYPDWLHFISPLLCPGFARIKHIPHMHIRITKWCIVEYGLDALWDFCRSIYMYTFSMISIKVCVYFLVPIQWVGIARSYCDIPLILHMSISDSFNTHFLNLFEPWLLMMVWDNQMLR